LNAISLFGQKAALHPEKMAITDIHNGEWSFQQIRDLSAKVQELMKAHHIGQEDSILLAIAPSPEMYAFVCAMLGLGVRIIFIEPWLKIERINEVILTIKPKVFISGPLGKIWGMRSKAIRQIPIWLSPHDAQDIPVTPKFIVRDLPSDHHGFVVFSSGTTGRPKGVIRTHDYLQKIVEIFIKIEPEDFTTPDLAVFPNVALFHLATGRGSIVIPQKWNQKNIKKLLPYITKYRPETMSTGPAFMKYIFDHNLTNELSNFKRVVIGGALTDCWIMEKAIKDFPLARILHIYGGSEAEPIATAEAKQVLKRSQDKGYFQVLCLGKPIEQIDYHLENEILWVKGPNVAGEYIGDPSQNKGIKKRDEKGQVWHCMGDRILEEDGFFWIQGRENQNKEDFYLEQKIYSFLKTSKCFITRNNLGQRILIGEQVEQRRQEIQCHFPEIQEISNHPIVRDRRHHSRIDRQKSLPKIYRKQTMTTWMKWATYLRERSPLSALVPLSAMGAISSLAFKAEFEFKLFIIGILFNTMLFIQLRLGDEVKDFEKDKIVNPTRPLPRGLLQPKQVLSAMNIMILLILIGSMIIGYYYNAWGGSSLAIATIFGWLMYHEFFIGQELNKSPLLYALTHQVIVFFIYGWIGLSSNPELAQDKIFLGWLVANFGSSFTYEICRKLNPDAHPMAQTYAHHYGRQKTAAFCLFFVIFIFGGASLSGFGPWMILPLLLFLYLILKWVKEPQIYKKVEGMCALTGVIVAVAPAIMWLIRNWRT
jgi:acyl-CoA synthetase (AMP-forming)/AMP-acid ligase II/4-hydroxybenzoate polyprenyltransferase